MKHWTCKSGVSDMAAVEMRLRSLESAINRRNWRPSFAANLFASVDWDYVFTFGPMHVGRR